MGTNGVDPACSFSLSARLFLPNTANLLSFGSPSNLRVSTSYPTSPGFYPASAERLYPDLERLTVDAHALAFRDASVQVELARQHLAPEVVAPAPAQQAGDARATRKAHPDALFYLQALLTPEVLHLVDQLPHEPLVEELRIQLRAQGHGEVTLARQRVALSLFRLHEQLLGEERNLLPLHGHRHGLPGNRPRTDLRRRLRQSLPYAGHEPTVLGPDDGEVRLEVVGDHVLHRAEAQLLDVEFVEDNSFEALDTRPEACILCSRCD